MKRRPPTDKWATSETPHIVDHLTYGLPRFVSWHDAGNIFLQYNDMWPRACGSNPTSEPPVRFDPPGAAPLNRFQGHHRIPLLRRLYDQRDEARSERDTAIAVRDHLRAELDDAIAERDRRIAERDAAIADLDGLRKTFNFFPNMNWQHTASFVPFAESSVVPGLAKRLCASYRHQIDAFEGFGSSFWNQFLSKNQLIHDSLLNEDISVIDQLIVDPCSTNLFYGFDSSVGEIVGHARANPAIIQPTIVAICDRLMRLAEAIGAKRMLYPEALESPQAPDIDALIRTIELKLGLLLSFPNPFPQEFGVITFRGLASYRAIQAIYQAYRIDTLSDQYDGGIVEIGAGLGRTAYYAFKMGLNDYTIVDIPLTTVAQAIFLTKTLGPDAVTLPGERHQKKTIRIESPSWFLKSAEKHGVVANVNSLVEMDDRHAKAYVNSILERASVFLSINHEYNPILVRDLICDRCSRYQRFPYWMRKGYAEEVFTFAK